MTRLSEALERARAAAGKAAETGPSADHSEPQTSSVPGSWRFDTDEVTPGVPSSSDLPRDTDRMRATDAAGAQGAATETAGEYPFANTAGGKLAVGPKPDPTLVEQHRHLAAALHHAQLRSGARTVMVISAVEAEGKTTTAANVALTLSHSHQRRVLLIDADLRRPSLHQLFELDNQVGLGDTLRSGTPSAPLHRISPTLHVITAGQPMKDPMSALVSDTMRQFLIEAAEHFDWVVLDTPPVALLSDANLLAEMIDQALLVVSASTTPYPLVKRAIDAIGSDRILGVVLNRAQRADIVVGYGYNYYGYSYAPTELPKKRSFLPFRRQR